LDEPTKAGLDPIQILQVLALIGKIKGSETVLLSTPHVNEIEASAQRVLNAEGGQIVLDEPLNELLEKETINQFTSPITLEQIFIDYHQDTPLPPIINTG